MEQGGPHKSRKYLGGIKQDTADIKADTACIKEDTAEIKKGISEINTKMATHMRPMPSQVEMLTTLINDYTPSYLNKLLERAHLSTAGTKATKASRLVTKVPMEQLQEWMETEHEPQQKKAKMTLDTFFAKGMEGNEDA